MPLVKRDKPSGEAPAVAAPTVDEILADLASASASTRRGAARLSGEYPDTADALCAAVVREENESVREAIFTALIRIGTAPVACGLVPLLQSEDVGLRNGAIEALKTMPVAASERINAIFAGSRDVRIFGVEILGALAHPESPRWLVKIIEDDTELNVCAAAVEALAECGDADCVPPLRRLLDRFPDEPFLEFSVRTAIARIAGA